MIRAFHTYLYGPDAGPFSASFDETVERLSRLDRLYCEPDGSFAWSPSQEENLFGMVYDAVDRVQYIELRGQCRRETWTEVVRAIGGKQCGGMMVMCLHQRQMKNLQSFEDSIWKSD